MAESRAALVLALRKQKLAGFNQQELMRLQCGGAALFVWGIKPLTGSLL